MTSTFSALVTGGAGFIGCNLARHLLSAGHRVRIIDNFSTGARRNLAGIEGEVDLLEGDLRDPAACARAVAGIDVIFHVAALPSVPRSLADPIACHENNVTATINVLHAAHTAGVRRVVYSASSSAYGDTPTLPKVESMEPLPRSPYAAAKLAGECYTLAYARAGLLEGVALRYFNVFGPRQDPDGPYAAVMPRWFSALLAGRDVAIFGDGETSRDFCYVENVVQANLLAATVERPDALGLAYNVACGETTSLTRLFELIREQVARFRPEAAAARAVYRDFRGGDIRHSLADVGRARALLGYAPTHTVAQGLVAAAEWYAAAARRG